MVAPRALSPYPTPSSPDPYAVQASSPLFAKLPRELRDVVWGYVLGGRVVHMNWGVGSGEGGGGGGGGEARIRQLSGEVCVGSTHVCGLCYRRWGTRSLRKGRDGVVGVREVLGICRAVYFEAVAVLYSANTFDFTDTWPYADFRYLTWNVPISSLLHITSLNLTCNDIPYPTALSAPAALPLSSTVFLSLPHWYTVFKTLSLLKGLRNLQIKLVFARAAPNTAHLTPERAQEAEDELLAPLRQLDYIVGMRRREAVGFEVLLPEMCRGQGEVAGELKMVGWTVVGD
ncbi:hypothetical protein K505DRAFT_373929 [Melanomma pulvis-pyrius CBS 109.77]|uniref:DUF7730 domain-containing protein n=1 Tax=Melanomma pulvis-pyrius CBS 109.77 TaxID=1314802 RepID=A0A6A6XFN5_9PLEO|nr:hypothetical protein K505DRAFT_373929 [Melanomma pulvis-pyrius CBS 109.77]